MVNCCLSCDFKSRGHGFKPCPCINYFVLRLSSDWARTPVGLSSDSDRTELGFWLDWARTELGFWSDWARTELGLLRIRSESNESDWTPIGLVGECKVLHRSLSCCCCCCCSSSSSTLKINVSKVIKIEKTYLGLETYRVSSPPLPPPIHL